MNELGDNLLKAIDSVIHVEWLSILVTIVIVLLCVIILSHLATRLLRRVLSRDNAPIPSSSILINIVRVVIWAIGISIILSSCFGINVTAAITALGVGGIAVSLGFQDTLSNLISGVMVTITGIIKPGDNISVGGQTGIVRDVTWRHTAIENSAGENIVIPNSVINTSALIKLRPITTIPIPVVVTVDGDQLSTIARNMEEATDTAVSEIDTINKPSRVRFSEVDDYGYKGTLTFSIIDDTKVSDAKDAALRAIAQYVH